MNIAHDEKVAEYSKIISELSKEKWYIKLLSISGVLAYIFGLIIFTLIAMQNIL